MSANVLFRLSIRRLGMLTMSLPAFGTIFCVVWSMMYNFESSTRTHCQVTNFLPSVSSAIGGFTPQRYVWRCCIALHSAPRLFFALAYYYWHMQEHVGKKQYIYKKLVAVTMTLNVIENMCLVGLTYISSSDNNALHESSFIGFIVTSQLYMFFKCAIEKWARHSTGHRTTSKDNWTYSHKKRLCIFNISCFLLATYLYFRHNWYCEPFIYSWFAFFEYLTIFSNIAFHGMAIVDMDEYSPAVVRTALIEKQT